MLEELLECESLGTARASAAPQIALGDTGGLGQSFLDGLLGNSYFLCKQVVSGESPA